MLSKTKILSAMVGLAMLTLPTAALAGHHHDDDHFHGPRWHHEWREYHHDDGWHRGWYKHDDDDDGWRWRNRGSYGYNGAYNYGYVPGGYYAPNQLNSLLVQRQRALVEMERLRARGDSRGAARMATVLQGLNGRIARAQGGYGYAAPVAPIAPYPGAYAPYSYGGYPYYGNTAGAVNALVGPLLGLR